MTCVDCGEREALKGRKICTKCKTIRQKKSNPYKYAYRNFLSNIKRRGKDWEKKYGEKSPKYECTITFEEFKQFAVSCQLLSKRGRSKESYHIDRIDETLGYHIWNIQPLTNEENVRKSHMVRKHLVYDKMTNQGQYVIEYMFPAEVKKIEEIMEKDLPF